MPQVRRVIRKVDRAQLGNFDEQLWPVNLALAALAALVAGIIVSISKFDDPRLLYNGWARLATLGVTVAALFWTVFKTNRRVARRLQLGVLVSLLVHFAGAIYLNHQHLRLAAVRSAESERELAVWEEVPIVPEYALPLEQPIPEPFERPVETPIPAPLEQPVMEPKAANEIPVVQRPIPQPNQASPMRPSPVELPRQHLAAPRRAEQASKLSKQTELAAAESQLAHDVSPLQDLTPQRAPHENLDATTAGIERQQSELEARKPADLTTVPQEQATQLARRTVSESPLTPAAVDPRLPRKQADAALAQDTAAAPMDSSHLASPAPGPELAPALTSAERAPAGRPEGPAGDDLPTALPAYQVARSETLRQQGQDTLPSIAPTRVPTFAKQQTVTGTAPETIETPELRAQASQANRSPVAPTASGLERAATAGPIARRGVTTTSDFASDAPPDGERAMPARLVQPTDQPGVVAGRGAEFESGATRQAATGSVRVNSPLPIEGPSVAHATGQGRAAAQPSGTELSKTSGGFVGRGTLPSASADLATDQRPATSLPRATTRGAAAGESDTMSELAPSAPAPIARSQAEAVAPAAGMPVQNVGSADLAGAGRPAPAAQASPATLERVGAAVPTTKPSGGNSEGEHDLAPPNLPAETKSARPGTGGRPEVLLGAQQPRMPRSRTAGVLLPASAAPLVGDVETDSGEIAGNAEATTETPGAADFGGRSGLPGRDSAPTWARKTGTLDTPGTALNPGSLLIPKRGADEGLHAGGPTSGDRSPLQGKAPSRKKQAATLAAGTAAPVDDLADLSPSSQQSADASGSGAAGLATKDLPTPRAVGNLPLRVEAAAGPGGLGNRFTPEVGLPDRRARRESEVIHNVPEKFLNKKVGGLASLSGTARNRAEPFARRGRDSHDPGNGEDGRPSFKTEAAIELGLEFLARTQAPNGSWSLNYSGANNGAERPTLQSDTAATGLALLAMLGAGYDHFDDKYQQRVRAALEYLIANQKEDGDLFVSEDQASNQVAHLYSHGIAAIALCEAYGMTGDPKLEQPAQKALDFIVAAQHPERGGWRYSPRQMSDLSVSGWHLMAMKSGELAGLKVPRQAYERVEKLLNVSQEPGGDGSRYVYNPWALDRPETRHGRRASTVMTSVGLLMRLYTGWNRNTREMRAGANHLLSNLPEPGTTTQLAPNGTLGNPLRDTYYWYYATQVMFHMQGEYWKRWNERLHPLLVDSQVQEGPLAGSWHPLRPVPDRWGSQAGRLYVTAMNLLSLEVYYRHLPIYESTAQ